MKHTQLILVEHTAVEPARQQQAIRQAVATWLSQALYTGGRWESCAVPSMSD